MALHITTSSPRASKIRGHSVPIRLSKIIRQGEHHYAGKACKLLRQIAVTYGMDVLWITCNPDNWPSRKTCEWIGATLVEIVDLPPENYQYKKGERRKCRYRWILY